MSTAKMLWSEIEDDTEMYFEPVPSLHASSMKTPATESRPAAADAAAPAAGSTVERKLFHEISPIKADEGISPTKEEAHDDEEETPTRKRLVSQEVLINCTIPYKLKSIWSADSASEPKKEKLRSHHSSSRYQRATEEIEIALRNNGDELAYTDLMKQCRWRMRFQPTFGSLFTFLKRHSSTFQYKHGVVKLLPHDDVVHELLQMSFNQ